MHTLLTQAEIDFEMWQAMRKARADHKTAIMLNRRYGRFYIAAENALLNSLITILYKAFETRKDTVSFSQLLKTIPKDADPTDLTEIKELTSKTKATWIKVNLIRNNVVGHQSMKKPAGEFHKDANMTATELEQMIKDAQRLLYLIAHKFHDTHVVFNLRGTHSFDNLINDLRTNNSFKPTQLGGAA